MSNIYASEAAQFINERWERFGAETGETYQEFYEAELGSMAAHGWVIVPDNSPQHTHPAHTTLQ